jgi:hypothetical protein
MNKYLIAFVVIIVAALVLFASTTDRHGDDNLTVVASGVMLDRESHDFGNIDIFGGKVSTDYILTNEGAEDVTVTAAVTSCMCTEGEIDGVSFSMHNNPAMSVVIPAGSQRTLTAIYDPLAHGPDGVGPVTRQLMLKTNSSITPEIEVRLSANVTKDEN